MALAKFKLHLITNHSHMISKSPDYFKWLLTSQNKHSKASVSKVTVSEKAQKASHLVAELTAQRRKSHTVGENLVMPACKIKVGKMLGKDALEEIGNVPLSNSAINTFITCHMMLKRYCVIN
jgi:hypothetical protein